MFPYWYYAAYVQPNPAYARLVLAEQVRHNQARALCAGRIQGYAMAMIDQIEDEVNDQQRRGRQRQRGQREPGNTGQVHHRKDRDAEYARNEDLRTRGRSRSRPADRIAYCVHSPSHHQVTRTYELETEHRGRSRVVVSRQSTVCPEDSISNAYARVRPAHHRQHEPETRGGSRARPPKLSTIYSDNNVSTNIDRPRHGHYHHDPERRGRSFAPTDRHYERPNYPPTQYTEHRARSPHRNEIYREPAQSATHLFTRDDYRYSQNYINHQISAPTRHASRPPPTARELHPSAYRRQSKAAARRSPIPYQDPTVCPRRAGERRTGSRYRRD